MAETALLRLRFSTRGASPVGAELLAYPLDPRRPEAVVSLLGDEPARLFLAQSGWVSPNGALPDHRSDFAAEGEAQPRRRHRRAALRVGGSGARAAPRARLAAARGQLCRRAPRALAQRRRADRCGRIPISS
ncbi:MAG: YidC/Oxa1 family insertase periplasmic-domain containing protein [Xanthomonadales bacterium]|nr:YidC/Oxa1 family insertase periplasmic-domain containing protein [Xanthomonadales bacterium]